MVNSRGWAEVDHEPLPAAGAHTGAIHTPDHTSRVLQAYIEGP